jgi:ribosomal protein S12 methylthiotransferase accessory factor
MVPLEPGQVLALRPGVRAEPLDETALVFLGERDRTIVSAPRAALVVGLVDGQRTVDDVVREARVHGANDAETLYTLERLAGERYLIEATSTAPAVAAFWEGAGAPSDVAIAALSRTRVSVEAIGDAGLRGIMLDALVRAGVLVESSATGADLAVVVTDDGLHAGLDTIHARMRVGRSAWCIVCPTGVVPTIGPILGLDGGPCFACLRFWLRNSRPVETLLERRNEGASTAVRTRGALPASVRAACDLAALGVAKVVVSRARTERATLEGNLVAIDLRTLQTSTHAVVRRPQCASCGDPRIVASMGERPVVLRPVLKRHRDDGGYRSQSPREVHERLRGHVSPITGAVAYLHPLPGRDSELRSLYVSGYVARPADGVVPRSNVFDKSCAGKGRSPDQARASALCEALERFCGVHQGDEARRRASRAELGPDAFAPLGLMNFSEAQLDASPSDAPRADARLWVPARSDDDTTIDWALAWSLTKERRRYVPFTYCYAEAPVEAGTAYCRPSGNGVAAGSCLEEAILQGLLELVERDAVAVWWYNRLRRPAIALESFGEPYFTALQRDYERVGWTIWVLDVTHDLGIAACVALAHEPARGRFAVGFGCHVEPKLAVQRSLTELNQLFDPTGSRRAPWDHERLPSTEFLFPDADVRRVEAGEMPAADGADLLADIDHCRRRIEGAGLEVVVVDKSRPDVDLAVAQVIVPGLRHFWPRFGAGRLYDVPCSLGWLRVPRAERELNPVPLFV